MLACAIQIPAISSSLGRDRENSDIEINNSTEDSIVIFPDELPEDHNDLIDVLRSELAPFRVWRSCAVSSY
jgi:hypothetical protein